MATRGDRVREVRKAGGWGQEAFAAMLNQAAEELGVSLDGPYDDTKVSKMENGRRDVSLTDAILVAHLDPLKRGVPFVAGVRKVASRPVTPPQSKKATGEGGHGK